MDAVRSLFIRETVCALEYPFQNGNFDPYWDGSYPPSPPVNPSAVDDSALPGGGRDTSLLGELAVRPAVRGGRWAERGVLSCWSVTWVWPS